MTYILHNTMTPLFKFLCSHFKSPCRNSFQQVLNFAKEMRENLAFIIEYMPTNMINPIRKINMKVIVLLK